MDITIPFAALLHLERLTLDLQEHYYALKLLAEADESEWSDARYILLYERVAAMEETVRDLQAFENALQL